MLCNKMSLAVGLIVAGALMPSCVTSGKYRAAENEAALAREERDAAGTLLSEAEEQLVDAEGQRASLMSKAAMAEAMAAENAQLKAQIEELSKSGRIVTPTGTVLFTEDGKYGWRAQGDVVFAQGSDKLTGEGERIIGSLATELKKGSEPITVIGHTDSDPIVKTADIWKRGNIELGANRAMSVKEYLVKQGVPESRICITSWAQFKPIASGTSADAKKKNRRVEVMTQLPAGAN